MEKLNLNELETINGGGKKTCDWGMLLTSTAASAGYGAAFGTAFGPGVGTAVGAAVGLGLGAVGIIGCGGN
ncbi:Blp family class II bacteriocin [Clostridium perfringens]|jgi:lactobin A/cerein 7B family class IIb bacteriocin|uniref:Bacteriocin n=1 Tax=Clostridium perfringens E str. JGS1987 TaxID=451755 RepID=B1BU36_CLOPF|nr:MULTISPECIES: Blp family class II bacteriocin [Clostridium]EDT14778.1 hypothetical protein AC3_0147 [Clostridium perfringens E str. JGS1987]ELC8355144.1 Blp family class II bacteriocin [Clostridium perfringens]ELC8423320.1 Blp family class II bacteriocin [Clostridium perfringens]ELC8451697.1 Blp family class II bacteriocin [Clostridium perfringens]MBI6069405.1 class IIb bacteriocin, lactobin A/cerein 7B family [Clostridium perfringens]